MGRRRPRRWSSACVFTSATYVVALMILAALPTVRAYPVLPIGLSGQFLTNLSAPPLAPGSGTTVGFTLRNPLPTPMISVSLTFSLYAFNAFPGNATGPIPASGYPTLSNGPSGSLVQSYSAASLAPGGSLSGPPLSVNAPSDAPQGTYAIRTSLVFQTNGSGYLLESRGYFTDAQWANATTLPGGGSTLNLTRLNVSGVLPETAVLVRANELSLPIYLILVAGVVLAAAGGYAISRRGPGSKSGTRGSPEERRAPRALGKRRKRDGD